MAASRHTIRDANQQTHGTRPAASYKDVTQDLSLASTHLHEWRRMGVGVPEDAEGTIASVFHL